MVKIGSTLFGVLKSGSSAVIVGSVLAACAEAPAPKAPPPPPPPPVVIAVEAPPPPPPPPPPPEAPKPEPLQLPAPIVFGVGSAELSPESMPPLKIVAAYLEQQSKVTLLRIEGHTDDQGAKRVNQKLSEQRALAVASWLTKNGVDCKRLVAVGFGDTKPIAPNSDDDGRSRNRRTVFIDAAIDGRSVGGPADGGGHVAGDPCKE